MDIKAGEKVAILGGDGSGRSTLLKLLTGLYAIQIGEYYIGKHSIRELDRGELKGKISVVFQDFVKYNFSLRRNITLSAEQDRINKSRYNEILEVTGIDKIIKAEKIEDSQILGKYFSRGRDLSPGNWQRIAIARMLYRNRRIFIMDEPFTYLDDPSSAELVENIIAYLGKDKTLIFITQDAIHLKNFDQIYMMEGGEIIESGTYEQLIEKKGAFYKEVKYTK
jgi:ABC-type multidrug transport system fused ATPase/permease subunit